MVSIKQTLQNFEGFWEFLIQPIQVCDDKTSVNMSWKAVANAFIGHNMDMELYIQFDMDV